MSASKHKSRLGKGLSSLFESDTNKDLLLKNFSNKAKTNIISQIPQSGLTLRHLSIDKIDLNPEQPRKIFEEKGLLELAKSIKQNGLLTPIIVRAKPESERFELIAGERRVRAVKIIGLKEILSMSIVIEDRLAFTLSLIENLQRKNLDPIEEASAFKKLIESNEGSVAKVSESISKSSSYISNSIRLLKLPDEIQNALSLEKISVGHARAIICSENQLELFHKIVDQNLSVREVEKLVREQNQLAKGHKQCNIAQKTQKGVSDNILDTHDCKTIDDKENFKEIENLISDSIGMDVSIKDGSIEIKFNNFTNLDLLVEKLAS